MFIHTLFRGKQYFHHLDADNSSMYCVHWLLLKQRNSYMCTFGCCCGAQRSFGVCTHDFLKYLYRILKNKFDDLFACMCYLLNVYVVDENLFYKKQVSC